MNNRIDAIYARQSVDKKDSMWCSCFKFRNGMCCMQIYKH